MSGSRGLIKTVGVIVARGLIDVADRELLDFNKTERGGWPSVKVRSCPGLELTQLFLV